MTISDLIEADALNPTVEDGGEVWFRLLRRGAQPAGTFEGHGIR